MTAATLGLRRLAWHTEASAARDARMTGWNREKADAARFSLSTAQLVSAGPRGLRARNSPELAALARNLDVAWIEAIALLREGRPAEARSVRFRAVELTTGWADCGCGRVFQPGENLYRQCYLCNLAERSDGTVSCALCARRHSMSYGACFTCKSAGREDTAALLRSTVNRRDGFTCSMCASTEGSMQVNRIDPDGSAWAWNVQTLCTPCDLIKGKAYGPLDELARLDLMLAYAGRSTTLPDLSRFLFPDERTALRNQLDDLLGDFEPRLMPKYRNAPQARCDELDGLVTALHAFDRPSVFHVSAAEKAFDPTSHTSNSPDPAAVDLAAELPDPCKGEFMLSTGARACHNRVDHRCAGLCTGPCA